MSVSPVSPGFRSVVADELNDRIVQINAIGGPLNITASATVTPGNQALFNGRTLVFSSALTITLSPGLLPGFGFACYPPSSGSASIASSGGVLLNGAGTTLTRTRASNTMFAVVNVAQNSFAVTGT